MMILMAWICNIAFSIFQEIWNSPYSNDSFPVYAEDIDAGGDASPSTAMLSEVSSALKITIIGGSIPERCGDRLYNTCCVFGSDGILKAKHRKVVFLTTELYIYCEIYATAIWTINLTSSVLRSTVFALWLIIWSWASN